MTLDIRKPIGVLFVLLGAILVLFGVCSPDARARMPSGINLNINVCWGLVLLVFGGLMLGAMRWSRYRRPGRNS